MMSEVTNENVNTHSEEEDIRKHYENMEVLAAFQPIVTMMAQQEERLSRKIDNVHTDVRRINGSVADAHKEIAEMKTNCAVRGVQCEGHMENVKNAKWLISHLAEMSKRPKTAVVIFVIFIIAVQTLVLESIKHNWLNEVWNYVRLIF